MTVAAFNLACEECHESVGILAGAVEKFLCWRCTADKAFGGKDVSVVAATKPGPAAPVPANPGGTTAAQTVVPPTPSAGLSFRCPQCNRSKPWNLQRPPWPGAVCYDCFLAGRGATRPGGA